MSLFPRRGARRQAAAAKQRIGEQEQATAAFDADNPRSSRKRKQVEPFDPSLEAGKRIITASNLGASEFFESHRGLITGCDRAESKWNVLLDELTQDGDIKLCAAELEEDDS